MIFSKFTEVAEVFTRAIRPLAISASGFRWNSRMEFTGPQALTDRSGSSTYSSACSP
ncbi:hypothetical protein D3C81_1997390 [compost metagenome]